MVECVFVGQQAINGGGNKIHCKITPRGMQDTRLFFFIIQVFNGKLNSKILNAINMNTNQANEPI